MSVKKILQQKTAELAPHFKPALLQRRSTRFQFVFKQDDPFYLVVDGESFEFMTGQLEQPTVTLFIDQHETCWQLLTGTMDGMVAFMTGRYRADGNIVLSQLLLYLFRSDDPTILYQVKD